MNIEQGTRRTKTIWTALVLGAAGIIAALLASSDYQPALMKQFALYVVFAGLALTVPWHQPYTFKMRLACSYFGVLLCAYMANDAFIKAVPQGKSASTLLVVLGALGLAVLVVWSAIEYVIAGFRQRT